MEFQYTLPYGSDEGREVWVTFRNTFQYTLPYGSDNVVIYARISKDISIHASVWKRLYQLELSQRNDISIHASVWKRLPLILGVIGIIAFQYTLPYGSDS